MEFDFFGPTSQHQQGVYRIGHAASGAHKPLHHRSQSISLGQTLQLQFQNFKAALHHCKRRAQLVAHIARKIALALHKAVQGFFARGNGPCQHAHLVIQVGERYGWHVFYRLCPGLQIASRTAFYSRRKSAQRACEPTAQYHGKHHSKPKATDGAEQQYTVKALF